MKGTLETYWYLDPLPPMVTLTLLWRYDDNGTHLVTCKELPEVATFVETPTLDEIERVGCAAIGEAIAARKARGEPLP